MLDINHLSFSRGNHKLLDNVSARLPTNQITALIGPNGVGKSTLIQLLTAELLPDSGSVINQAKHVAVLSQHNQLYEPLTVRELLQLSHATMDEEVINTLQLTPLLDQEMTDLSGGQQQLAWLGFVLQQQPDLLILDEPTTFLDLHFQELFLKTLQQLQEKRQMTVLMVLHDLNQAFRYSQHIWLLRRTADLVSEAAVLMQNQIDLLSEAFETPLQLIKTPNQTIIQPK
ncbi:ABC transporter ATP-binding protein [Weissella paramesenteroides]|jgi:ABC-type cobalamin/Fe3+-siderophores transport system ATPase subunit|uniref:ABC transporter ATP-binding protein n=1 Tax=Weissella paramesenteroides TaxID=1249 RepID=UPI002E7B5B85|nr:ABC transporter ATP-binding protein [Weissella paramesenteroides]WPQ68022.1 ABC transporter ATP-binding protein [Weissella paramesenteroides]